MKKPKLGTDRKSGWRYYSIHMMATYVMKERILVANYRRCIELAFPHGDNTARLLEDAEKRDLYFRYQNEIKASAAGLTKWAKNLEKEDYHEIYVHSFIGLWSSFEAGIENIVSDYLQNDKASASEIVKQLKGTKFTMADWPWSAERSLRVASQAERQAMNKTQQGRYQIFNRLQTLFSWIGMDIQIEKGERDILAEAKLVRNILLHRNGEVGARDVSDCPSLKAFVGSVIPFNETRFQAYASAVSSALVSILHAASRKEKNETTL